MKKAVALITALLLLCPLWGCRRNDSPPMYAEESEPLSYAYTLCVTINPQLTLFMDAGDRVVGVRADNADAETDFAGVALTGKTLAEALGVIVDTAAEKGRLNNGGQSPRRDHGADNKEARVRRDCDDQKAGDCRGSERVVCLSDGDGKCGVRREDRLPLCRYL